MAKCRSGSDIISKELRIAREKGYLEKTLFIKNLSADDFLILLNNSKCIVGNSSVGIKKFVLFRSSKYKYWKKTKTAGRKQKMLFKLNTMLAKYFRQLNTK